MPAIRRAGKRYSPYQCYATVGGYHGSKCRAYKHVYRGSSNNAVSQWVACEGCCFVYAYWAFTDSVFPRGSAYKVDILTTMYAVVWNVWTSGAPVF